MAKTVSFTSAGKRQLHDEMLCERMFLHRTGSGANRWHIAGEYCPSGVTDFATSANYMYVMPFFAPPFGAVADRLGIYVRVEAGSGNARLGIYTAQGRNNNYYPGALLVDGGEVDVSTPGEKTVTIDQALETTRLYYAALLTSCYVEVSRTHLVSAFRDNLWGAQYSDFSAQYFRNMLLVSWGYGPLPTTFPDPSYWEESAAGSPRIGIRYSA